MARPPVDPRLWRYARSARRYLVGSVGLSLIITVAIVVAAIALGRVLAGVITDPSRREISAWTVELIVLTLAIGIRVLATWTQSRIAHRAGATVVAELEQSVLAAGAQLPPRELDSRRTELAVVVGTGLSGLRGYLTGYLPALLLAVAVPPVVLAVIAVHDLTSGIIVVITLPLIPIFMILIGLLTEGRARATLDATTRLSDQLLDLFAGMPTLRALGRESADPTLGSTTSTMQGRVRELSDTLRERTMSALRIAFLSSMVLELLATLSVALVAVSIGLRLVFGEMSLYAGIVALVLAPEVYLPLRTVGERFHAAEDGMAAADKAFAVLDPPRRTAGVPGSATGLAQGGTGSADDDAAEELGLTGLENASAEGARSRSRVELPDKTAVNGTAPGVRRSDVAAPAREPRAGYGHDDSVRAVPAPGTPAIGTIELRNLTLAARDGFAPDGLSAVLRPGTVTMLTGPNGSGKSTVLQAILGLLEPDGGSVRVDGVDVRELDSQQWWSRVAWLPQRPVLVPGTLRENLELLGARVSGPAARGAARVLSELEEACAATGFDAVLDALPDRWDTVVGPGGAGLSLGQRQRLALTRVLAADRPILLLDEPTAHLDPASELAVTSALTARAKAGATVIVVAHRPSLLVTADHVVTVRATLPTEARP
ncbi:ABC transporter ATP-binding protein/permease [Nocardia donostiensis]|uniref:Cysteine ABC transporter ATP-binding protein n=1 Tax=Nocardia donostiensis TaxID=1538463 RepID=A0A1W0B9N7_9NOCA|nr:ATP-binding cassette domain-containing protein [Nocardia donostiensis]ONM49628.1 cysteine ABC transporter ATP-binding protein [Nocardia donostiensis]OQS19249.1 cysteine ABC transporter ATP-binding protein [Nocardia donostiensis]